MKVRLPLLALLALTACEAPPAAPPEPTPPSAPVAPAPPPAPDAPQPPAAPDPLLTPLVRADWADRLEPGFGCSLERGDDTLVVAVGGSAVARIAGSPPQVLTGVPTDLNALTRGGRFDAGFGSVEITPAPDLGEPRPMEGVVAHPVRVTATSGTRREQFEAFWACGS